VHTDHKNEQPTHVYQQILNRNSRGRRYLTGQRTWALSDCQPREPWEGLESAHAGRDAFRVERADPAAVHIARRFQRQQRPGSPTALLRDQPRRPYQRWFTRWTCMLDYVLNRLSPWLVVGCRLPGCTSRCMIADAWCYDNEHRNKASNFLRCMAC
jgi:hypothetical protein